MIMKMAYRLKINSILLLTFLITGITALKAQEKESQELRFRFVSGIGPMNLSTYESKGIQMNNSLEFEAKKWLLLAANLQMGKSGNNNSETTYFRYFPDFPENIETNFVTTDLKTSRMNAFSSVGLFVLLNPFNMNRTRFVFGPGLCFVSFEEITTNFIKGFKEYEYFEVTNHVRNSRKMDVGVRFSIEHYFFERVFAGISFQGYTGLESASAFSLIAGFRF